MYDPLRTISDCGIQEILATIPTAFGGSSQTPSTVTGSDESDDDDDDSDDGDYVSTEPQVAPSDNEHPLPHSEQT